MIRKEYLTCLEVHKRLKEKINGNIFITIKNNAMIVYINPGRGVRYKYVYECVSLEMIGRDLNYDKIARIIFENYKQFIHKKYFKEV